MFGSQKKYYLRQCFIQIYSGIILNHPVILDQEMSDLLLALAKDPVDGVRNTLCVMVNTTEAILARRKENIPQVISDVK